METISPIATKHTTGKSAAPFAKCNKETAFFKPAIQPKLTINQPGDVYEQEADAMADKIMRMPVNKQSFFSPKPLSISSLQRKCEHCQEEERLQMKPGPVAGGGMPAPTLVQHVVSSGGQNLDTDTRKFFESRFGHDFSHVQVHNDSMAHQSSSAINAQTYTHGNHIAFGAGQYQPSTHSGKQLLAHELTHVLQQNHGQPNPSMIQKDEAEETAENSGGEETIETAELGEDTAGMESMPVSQADENQEASELGAEGKNSKFKFSAACTPMGIRNISEADKKAKAMLASALNNFNDSAKMPRRNQLIRDYFHVPADDDLSILEVLPTIRDKITLLQSAFTNGGYTYDCTTLHCGPPGTIAIGADAYVIKGEGNIIHICHSDGIVRATDIIHEFGHKFAGLTGDTYCHNVAGCNAGICGSLSTESALKNADSYTCFIDKFSE